MTFSKNIYKTDLPCVWCCVWFCLCAFGVILKRFRRLLIFHVDFLLFESILRATIEPGLPVVLSCLPVFYKWFQARKKKKTCASKSQLFLEVLIFA